MAIHFHYPSNYFTAYSRTKIHNMYFFCIFLQIFSFQYFVIRPEKNPKTKIHKKTKATFYSFWTFPKKKPICIPAFHMDFKCCDLYQLSAVLKE